MIINSLLPKCRKFGCAFPLEPERLRAKEARRAGKVCFPIPLRQWIEGSVHCQQAIAPNFHLSQKTDGHLSSMFIILCALNPKCNVKYMDWLWKVLRER